MLKHVLPGCHLRMYCCSCGNHLVSLSLPPRASFTLHIALFISIGITTIHPRPFLLTRSMLITGQFNLNPYAFFPRAWSCVHTGQAIVHSANSSSSSLGLTRCITRSLVHRAFSLISYFLFRGTQYSASVTCRVTIPDRGPYPGPSGPVTLPIDTHSIVSTTAFPYAH
jgi:hypothetical protein